MASLKTKRELFVGLSDTHGGFKLGLLNPDTKLHDENEQGVITTYSPRLTASQEYLWDIYTQDIASARELAAGDRMIVGHHGDICHGDKYPHVLVSTKPADQIEIACANMRPWLDIPEVTDLVIIIGTEAHEFSEGTASLLVQKQLAAKYPDKTISVCYHGLISMGKDDIDCAHHGPTGGSRAWLSGNEARYYLKSLMLAEIMSGNIPPALVLRGHYHVMVYETVQIGIYTSKIMILPSYTFPADHGRQVTRSSYRITNGIGVAEFVNGLLLDIRPIFHTVDLRTRLSL